MKQFGTIIFCSLVLFCSNYPAIAANDSSDENARMQAANKVADSKKFLFFYVPSNGFIADSTFITLSKTSATSEPARQLAAAIINSDKQAVLIAVSGSSDRKTVQVIKNALSLTQKTNLQYLKLIFVGSKSSGKKVEKFVKEAGATFVFAEY